MNISFLICLLICFIRISIEDIRSFTIPDGFSVSAGLITVLISGRTDIRPAVVIMVGWLLSALLSCAAGKDIPMGMGDAKLMALLSIGMGWQCIGAFAQAAVLSGLFCIVSLLLRRLKPKDHIPFAPFICIPCFYTIIMIACNQSLI